MTHQEAFVSTQPVKLQEESAKATRMVGKNVRSMVDNYMDTQSDYYKQEQAEMEGSIPDYYQRQSNRLQASSSL